MDGVDESSTAKKSGRAAAGASAAGIASRPDWLCAVPQTGAGRAPGFSASNSPAESTGEIRESAVNKNILFIRLYLCWLVYLRIVLKLWFPTQRMYMPGSGASSRVDAVHTVLSTHTPEGVYREAVSPSAPPIYTLRPFADTVIAESVRLSTPVDSITMPAVSL